MGFLRFIFSKLFLVNVAIALLVAAVGVVGLFFWMEHYTQHNITVSVPNLIGVSLLEIPAIADTTQLEYEIIDSLYSDQLPPGVVAEQEPRAGYPVKCGRKVYLTVNAVLPKQVAVPDLTDLTLRQARSVLQTVGLKLGKLEYAPDIAKNAVLSMKMNEAPLKKGILVFSGSVIDLVLGLGLSNTKVPVPYLIYSKLEEAIAKLTSASLNLATFKMDTTVVDTGLARVYKQVPAFSETGRLNMGASVILYLTEDTTGIDYDTAFYTLPFTLPDSAQMVNEPYENDEEPGH